MMNGKRDHPSGKGPGRGGKIMTVMVYRTQDGLTNYGFSIDFQPDIGWRVYIIFRPVRQGFDDSQSLPYQAIDHEGRRYVDWSEKLDNLGDARTVATFWAELVQDYHRAQVKKALDDELVERYRRAQERKKVIPADPDRLGANTANTADTGAASPERQDRGSVIPHPRATAESLVDLQESA
jgi:hypothetical protein